MTKNTFESERANRQVRSVMISTMRKDDRGVKQVYKSVTALEMMTKAQKTDKSAVTLNLLPRKIVEGQNIKDSEAEE